MDGIAETDRLPDAQSKRVTTRRRDSARPEVSVVMVTHGAWDLTERALAALDGNTEAPFELIVVDNWSKDQTREHLSTLTGARVILNDENRGFGPATNQGAKHARADYLVLLNTDAFVRPDWLPPLLETVGQRCVGAVVPRFLHPDGSLQEAGALLAQDGSVVVYGDGDDPDLSSYRFRRVVDFGGAACMLIRRSAFEGIGGFDDLYAPAYYEDADLCLRLAERGLMVVYDPRSTVTHIRYGSGSTKNAIELTERNRRRFVDRWNRTLIGRPWTFSRGGRQAAIMARDARATPRVLICAPATKTGVGALALALLTGWPQARVTWCADPPGGFGDEAEALLKRGIELVEEEDFAWLEDRLFHYDVVVEGSSNAVRPGTETQPQALRVSLEQLAGPPGDLVGRLAPILAAGGITPPQSTSC